jgi:hypothetical protein
MPHSPMAMTGVQARDQARFRHLLGSRFQVASRSRAPAPRRNGVFLE